MIKKGSFKTHIKAVFNNDKGMTLVELLIVLALLGIVLGGIYQYFYYGYHSWMRSSAEAQQVQDARLAVIRMDGEVRGARQGKESTNPVVWVSDTEINIYTDTDNDGHPELVCYKLDAVDGVNSLLRGTASPQGDAYPYTYGVPGQWETVVDRVENDEIFTVPKYELNGSDVDYQRGIINVELHISAAEQSVKPIKVEAKLTVRGRGEVKT
jgi:prepilin-type N-terminal cleavage/methylation domain-containing protein